MGTPGLIYWYKPLAFVPTATAHLPIFTMADLGETLGHYFWLAETVAMKVRNIPDSEAHYDVESKAWTERRLLIPPRDDEEKRKAYFAFCDEICSMNPATPGECAWTPHDLYKCLTCPS
jgi:hypothetical protein